MKKIIFLKNIFDLNVSVSSILTQTSHLDLPHVLEPTVLSKG